MIKKTSLLLVLLISGLIIACDTENSPFTSAQAADDTPVILINPFVVPPGNLDETIRMWEQARDFLKQEPGYISTELHQSLAPDAPFQLINVAKWESAEAYTAATQKMRTEANLPRIEGVRPAPQLYNVIRR